MSAESAYLSTFGAETETEAEIRSTSTAFSFPLFYPLALPLFTNTREMTNYVYKLNNFCEPSMKHWIASLQLCSQPTVQTLTQSTTRFRGSVQERVYRSQIRDVDQLKSHLIKEWEHFHQVVIDEAVRQWRPRLRACVRAHGGHFEHRH